MPLRQRFKLKRRNKPKSLSGIETTPFTDASLRIDAEINLNPYQGLKQRNLKHEATKGISAEINLNPYQGLKPLFPHTPKLPNPKAEINLNPYQGLKLG